MLPRVSVGINAVGETQYNWSVVPERLSAARWCRLLLLLMLLLTRRQYVLARKQNLCARLYQGRGAQNVFYMFTTILVILYE